jgi:hypothetical protein
MIAKYNILTLPQYLMFFNGRLVYQVRAPNTPRGCRGRSTLLVFDSICGRPSPWGQMRSTAAGRHLFVSNANGGRS